MFDATTSYIGLYLFTKSVKNARSGTLPGFLAVFQTSKFEVRNTARPPGSVPELTGAIPDLTDAIPDLSGSITDLNYLKKCDVRNAARSLGTVPYSFAILRSGEVRNSASDVQNSASEVRNSASEVRNTAKSPGSVTDLKV